MGTHIAELIEHIAKGQIYLADEPVFDRSTCVELLESSICFDAGDYDELENFKAIKELIRLPFPTVYLEMQFKAEGEAAPILECFLCAQSEKEIWISFFQKAAAYPEKWAYVNTFKFDQEHEIGEFVDVYVAHGYANEQQKQYQFHSYLSVLKFLSALNCSNVTRTEHKPPEKLQRARAKRGKRPLFSFWTLEIALPKHRGEGESCGGTHATPRLHLRRGHPRQYAPGKYCWVQPCVVGNKQAGMVHKDYAARYTDDAVPNA